MNKVKIFAINASAFLAVSIFLAFIIMATSIGYR